MAGSGLSIIAHVFRSATITPFASVKGGGSVFGSFGVTTRRPMMRHGLPALVALALAGVPHASAQDSPVEPHIMLELNRAEDAAEACRLTFVASNGLDRVIDELTLEIVLFAADGLVDRITAFSFGAMAAGKTVVRQFAVPDARCEGLGRVLVNGVAACQADGLSPATCQTLLRTKARGDLQFGL